MQVLDNSGITCFSVYKVKSSPVASLNTTNHGIQIPVAVDYSQSSVQLNLIVDSNLIVNEQYSAIITDIGANGEPLYNLTVEFGLCYHNNYYYVLSPYTGWVHIQIHMMFSQ